MTKIKVITPVPGVDIDTRVHGKPEYYAQHYGKLIGRKIVGVQLQHDPGFGGALPVLVLDNNTAVFVLSDPEGNDAGHLDIVTK